jgi:hypothetical protein
MQHESAARTTENSAAGQHLCAQRGGLVVAGEAGGALELGQQIERVPSASVRD